MKKKKLQKELKKLRQTEAKRLKTKELKRKIWILKHGKYLRVGEKVREAGGRLGEGSRKLWSKMKEMEEKKGKKYSGENIGDKISDALSKAF